jgi:pentapeptide MXKDX repeat protein
MINIRSNKDINRISGVMSKNSSHRDQAIRKNKLLLDSTNLYMTDENIPKKTIKTKNNLINSRLLFKPSKKLSSRTSFISNDKYYPPFYMELIIPKPYDDSVLNEYYTIYIDRNEDENKNYESFEEHFRQRNIANQPKIARHIKYVNRPRPRHRPSSRPKHRPRHRPSSRPRLIHKYRSRYNNYYHNTIRYEHDYPYYYGQYLYYPFNYYFNLYDNNLPFDLNYAMIPLEIQDDSPKDGLSKDDSPKDGLSKDGLSKGGLSKDGLSKGGLSKDGLSKDGSSKKGNSSKVKELFIPEGYKLVKVKIVDKAKKINLDDSKYLLFFIILLLFYFIVVKGD